MKFVVWGNGTRGRHVVCSRLRQDIIAIVEKDKALQGGQYENINIISPDIYINEYRDYPVLVTPAYAEKEIIKQLNSVGIYWAFSYADEWISIICLFQLLSIDDMLSNYNQKETLAIWGYNALAIFLYDYLCNKGYSCVIILNDLINEDIKTYLEKILNVKLESKEDCRRNRNRILLTTYMSESEKVFFSGNKIEQYYDLVWEMDRFYNPLIEKYKAIHIGKRCFIVATGPSLGVADLEKLYQNKEICISMNGIFATFADTSWRPDYYIVQDPGALKMWKSQIINFEARAKFIADVAYEQAEDLGIKWHSIMLTKDDEIMDVSDDFAQGVFSYGSVTHAALQLAVYMGFTEIYLLGVDCNYVKGDSNNHFYKEKKIEQSGANTDHMKSGYRSIKAYADSNGIKIYNATRGGMLEIFERVNFDSLF